MSGGYLTAYVAGDDWKVDMWRKCEFLDTGGVTRENFHLLTHQALVLAVLWVNG